MTTYRFTDGDTVTIEKEKLADLLQQNKLYLQNYLEVEEDLDDPSYIARGNGFCDAKYSEDFVQSQIAKYEQRIRDVERWMRGLED